jgi:hypothetical protein
VNQFIEECRAEWKRLRVPDPVANEMAADLAADLKDAEAEGVSPEEVLGSGASDPRSFAASWAAERGVVPPPLMRARLRSRSLIHVALAALTLTAAIGAALVVFASPHAGVRMAAFALPAPPPTVMNVSFDGHATVWVAQDVARDAERQARNAEAQAAWLHSVSKLVVAVPQGQGSGVEIHTVGSILLIVGILGAILSILLLFWSSRRMPPPGIEPGHAV